MSRLVMAVLVGVLAAGCAGGLRIGEKQVGQVPPDAGVIAIESNVPGADVYLDGNLIGTVTRAERRQEFVVPSGEHELSVQKFAYQDWSRQVYVTPGARNTIDVYLERVPTRSVNVQ